MAEYDVNIISHTLYPLDQRQLSFYVLGNPPVQQRPKISYRGRRAVVYYDPSAAAKC
jgi:hypothetical protein